MKLEMLTLLKLLNTEESFTLITKWYNGTTDAIQVNNDKTYQEIWTVATNNVVVRGITIKELKNYASELEKFGFTKLDPIKY